MFTEDLSANFKTLGFFLFFSVAFSLLVGSFSVATIGLNVIFIAGTNFIMWTLWKGLRWCWDNKGKLLNKSGE